MASHHTDADVAQAITAIDAADRLDDLLTHLAHAQQEWERGGSERDRAEWWSLWTSDRRQRAELVARITGWPEWRAVAAVRQAVGDEWSAIACRQIVDFAARLDTGPETPSPSSAPRRRGVVA